MPLQATSGAASYDAFGGGVAAVPNYIEDVFSTYLYTGNGSTQTITNGIDLSTKGGLVWIKVRDYADSHRLFDTSRGVGKYLVTNGTFAETTNAASVTAFNSNGFSLGDFAGTNGTAFGSQYASWTFRKQPKFFDVVTYTGTGVARTIAHSLGSVPACIIVKCTNAAGKDWHVYHTSLGNASYINLNLTSASTSSSTIWNSTTPTSTVFSLGADGLVNDGGDQYVAYLFAHNAGGFGLTGTDNVISCGSYTGNGSFPNTITLGYEPQWVMIKKATSPSGINTGWVMFDNMRGLGVVASAPSPFLYANTSDAEDSGNYIGVTATGFQTSTQNIINTSGDTYIYIAIRRGPMKVPTSGTSVFLPTSRTGNASLTTVTSGFAPDVVFGRRVDTLDNDNESVFADKLRGSGTLSTNNSAAEYAGGATSGLNSYTNTGVVIGTNNSPIYAFNYSGLPYALYQFQRAPNFMDEVCFTYANTTNERITHNLAVAPELIIVKSRSAISSWACYISTSALASGGIDKYIYLNQGNSLNTNTNTWGTSDPTATTFGMSPSLFFSAGQTLVAYLFATCAGVSKVGSYTGTGSTQTIACGFTGGARFVLIKRTDTDGYGWCVFDTARGMVSGTDPYFALNSTSPQTNADNVYTITSGFQLVSASGITNASGGTYIFLAIA